MPFPPVRAWDNLTPARLVPANAGQLHDDATGGNGAKSPGEGFSPTIVRAVFPAQTAGLAMLAPSSRLGQLASPAFIVALALLVLNDFALKPLFHNALTGKLSDFAGLFALTLFVATLWPRHARIAGANIAAAFTFWKTSYVEPLIEALNAASPFAFGRTVDLTDLIALPMIPLAVFAAPRLTAWPLPRALQVGLAVLAPVAFTATSQPKALVRSTLDVSSVSNAGEADLRALVDSVAKEHGLSCSVCDSLDEGRVYVRQDPNDAGPDDFTVSFDSARRELFYTTTGFGRRGRAEVLTLSESLRAEMQERFPGVTAIEFADDFAELPENSTLFTVQLPAESGLSVEVAEQAKRTLSSIIEEIVRTHGLRTDERQLVHYAGRRFGPSAYDRDLILVPVYVSNSMLRVRAARQTSNYAALHDTIKEELAARLGAAFGAAAVTREDFQTD